MSKPIIFKDGHCFLPVTDKAKEIWSLALFELYIVYEDQQTESLIDSFEDLNKALEEGLTLCIEVGRIGAPLIESVEIVGFNPPNKGHRHYQGCVALTLTYSDGTSKDVGIDGLHHQDDIEEYKKPEYWNAKCY